jgi:hypothetical protein
MVNFVGRKKIRRFSAFGGTVLLQSKKTRQMKEVLPAIN